MAHSHRGRVKTVSTRGMRLATLQIAHRPLEPELRDEQIERGVIAIGQRDDPQSFRVQYLIAGTKPVCVEFLGDADVLFSLTDGRAGDVNSRYRLLTIEKGGFHLERHHRSKVGQPLTCGAGVAAQGARPCFELSAIKDSPLQSDAD